MGFLSAEDLAHCDAPYVVQLDTGELMGEVGAQFGVAVHALCGGVALSGLLSYLLENLDDLVTGNMVVMVCAGGDADIEDVEMSEKNGGTKREGLW